MAEMRVRSTTSCDILSVRETVMPRDYPALTRDDVRAVLAYADERIRSDGEDSLSENAISPQQFYAEISRRPAVSELFRRLAR